MKIDQLLTTLSGRGVTQAALRAGQQMQLQIDGAWQPHNANMTDESLSSLIEEALAPEARAAWDAADGRASFERQGFSVAARKSGGAVQILIKQSGNSSIAQNAAPLQSPVQSPAPVQAYSQAYSQTPVQGLAPAPRTEWYYIEGESENGPFPPQKMQLMISMGTLPAHTLAWRAGMENWTAIQSTELAAYIPAASAMAPIASPTGGVYQPQPRGALGGNDSGSGESAIVPPGIGNWNWGAFFLPVFWGFAHNQNGRACAIFLTQFIPYVGWLITIVLTVMMAMEGNALAWKHRRWNDVEHLKKTQKIWLFWGLGVIVAVGLIVVVLLSILGNRSVRP